MTIKDIAELAGVSVSTVSKIINNKDGHINEATRQRVLAIIKDYNYTPYAHVKNSNTTFTIGVLLPDDSFPAEFQESSIILNGIVAAAQAEGYAALVVRSTNSADSERKCLSMLISRNVSAIIWWPLPDLSDSYGHELILQELEHSSIPYIITGSSQYPNSVLPDYYKLGYDCALELIKKQHSKVLCITHDAEERGKLITKGFSKAYSEHGFPNSEQNILTLDSFLKHPEEISENHTAVFCTNYMDAQLVYTFLQNKNYPVPESKSLFTVLQSPNEALLYPGISGILENCQVFGEKLVRELIRMCELGHLAPETDSFVLSFDSIEGNTIDAPESHRIRSILSIGTINYDCTILSDSLPLSGTTLMAHSSSYSIGGKGLNQAVGVAKLGQKAILIGKLGDDASSIHIMEELSASGVLTHAIGREKTAETGKAFIQLETNGDSTITVVPGANKYVTPEYLDTMEEDFRNAAYCMISGETALESAEKACRLCRKYKVKSVYKPTAAKYLPDDLYPLVDYFIPNLYEASGLTENNHDAAVLADYFLQKGCGTVIITLGSKGCYVRSKDQKTGKLFPASKGFPVVDTTGAADAFISTFVSCLAKEYDLETSIQLAQISAGHMVSCIGTAPSMLDWETLKNLASREGLLI